jgi:hypothetical protein
MIAIACLGMAFVETRLSLCRELFGIEIAAT